MVLGRDYCRLESRRPFRSKRLFKPTEVMFDAGICQCENLHDRAIIHLELEFSYIGVSLPEGYNIFKICSAKAVNRLGVIAHDGKAAMFGCQQIDDSTLYGVRVLVFINENVQKLLCESFPDMLVLGQQPQPQAEQVIEVQQLPLRFSGRIEHQHLFYFAGLPNEHRIAFGQNVL